MTNKLWRNIMIRHKRIYFFCGVSMFFSEVWKQYTLTFIVNNGTYNWWNFPFQLCSIPMYVCIVLPFIKQPSLARAFAAFLMNYGLLGGIFVFFDTSGMHYSYLPLTIHSHLWHILLIGIGLLSGISKDGDTSFLAYIKSTALYVIGCIIATMLNLILHKYGTINMFYISPYYKMSQRVFEQIALSIGNNLGLLIYMLSIVTGAGVLHLFWYFLSAKISKYHLRRNR